MSGPVRRKSRFTPQEIHFPLTTVTARTPIGSLRCLAATRARDLVLAAGRALIRRVSYRADLDFRDSAGVLP
jgi:hypothetical protein